MSYQNYNQQQLPFPIDRQIQPPIQGLSLNNPPYVPQSYEGPQWMQNIVPVVAAATAIHVQSDLSNPLRVFMYNKMITNYFANADFDALVRGVLDFIQLNVVSGRYVNVDQGMQDAINRVCAMYCAANINIYPALTQYLDQAQLNTVQQLLSEFAAVGQSISTMKMQNSQSQQYQQQFQQPQYQQLQPIQPGYGRSAFNNQSYQTPPRPIAGNMVTSGNTFTRGNNFQVTNQTPATRGGGKYDRAPSASSVALDVNQPTSKIQQPFNTRTTAMNNVKEEKPKGPTEVLVKESKHSWKPLHALKHYFPAFNPVKQDLYYLLNADGGVTDIVRRDKEKAIMDQDRHSLSTVFGKIPENLDLASSVSVINAISTGVNNLNNVSAMIRDNAANEDPQTTDYLTASNAELDSRVHIESSLSDAWTTLSVCRLEMAKEDGPANVFRGYYITCEALINDSDDTDTLRHYNQSITFAELVESMKHSVNIVNIEFWTRCNQLMTEAVNHLLKQELSIPGLQIDSFYDDVLELVDYIGNKFGGNIQRALLNHQACCISSTLFVVENEYNEAISYLSELHLRDLQNTPNCPKITYLSREYILTYIDCTAFELNIDLASETAALVDVGANSSLHSLLHELFVDAENRNCKNSCALIKTKDGRIIEATIGLVNAQSYLLTLIK